MTKRLERIEGQKRRKNPGKALCTVNFREIVILRKIGDESFCTCLSCVVVGCDKRLPRLDGEVKKSLTAEIPNRIRVELQKSPNLI